MKKRFIAIFVTILASLLTAGMVSTQAGKLTLNMSRDWGYGGFNGDIQGLFSMHVTGPNDLARVVFFIDSTKIGELDKAPFNLQFNTDNYSLGLHQMTAVGYSCSGKEYPSNVISTTFVPQQSTIRFILPVLGVVLVAILISALVPFLTNHSKHGGLSLGTERNYGVSGGAICPKCNRPFVLPLYSLHLGFSKIAICPYCNKWSMVRRESIEKLRQAEKAELGIAQPSGQPVIKVEDEQTRKDLDESKYQD